MFMVVALILTLTPVGSTINAEENGPSIQFLGENKEDIGQEVKLNFVKEYTEYENPNEIEDRYYFIEYKENGSSVTTEISEQQAFQNAAASETSSAVTPSSLNGITVSTRVDAGAKDARKANFKATIMSITGSKPNKLDFKLNLGRSMTRSTTTNIVSSVTYTLSGVLGIKVGATVTHSFDATVTGFYTVVSDITAKNILGVVLGTDTTNTSTILLNTKGNLYPIYTDVASAKVMKEPARADWARTTPISWTTSDRNKYIDWYNKEYPNNYDWTLNHVHHMRPRNLGGTNDYSNLIPILNTHHTSVVSPWFVAY